MTQPATPTTPPSEKKKAPALEVGSYQTNAQKKAADDKAAAQNGPAKP